MKCTQQQVKTDAVSLRVIEWKLTPFRNFSVFVQSKGKKKEQIVCQIACSQIIELN